MAESRRGIRTRLTAAATALVAVVLAAAAGAMVLGLGLALRSTLDDSARQRARDVAALVDSGNLPSTVPATGGTVLVQVVDARGRVLASTPGGDALTPVLGKADLDAVRRGATRQVSGARIGLSDPLRIVGAAAGDATGDTAGPVTVLVAVSSGATNRSLHLLTLVLAVGVPLLVGAFALACWLLVGAALRPVESLRHDVGEITEAASGARLTVPQTRDEVARLAETLNDMLDRLAAGGVRQRAFVADAAHELRSPLASLQTQLEVARAHPDPADWEEVAEGALVDVARLTRLVDGLLVLARLDDGAARTRAPSPVDLHELAAAAVARTAGTVPVHLVGAAQPVTVVGDRDALARVLDNLLSNAVRHAGARIDVETRLLDDLAVLTVTDDGPGIAAADRERAFERFTRLDASRAQSAGGSGLGLAIVRELVRSAGGTVTLEDATPEQVAAEQGRPGLRAVVRLPAALPRSSAQTRRAT